MTAMGLKPTTTQFVNEYSTIQSNVKDLNVKSKIKKLGKLSESITLVTVDVVAFYPSIPHENGLETLTERFVKSEDPPDTC